VPGGIAWANEDSSGTVTEEAPSEASVKQKIVITAKSNQSIGDTEGYEFYSDRVTARATLFRTDVSDLISCTNIAGSARQYVNVSKAGIQGIELETLFKFNRFVQLRLGYQYLATEDDNTEYDAFTTYKAQVSKELIQGLTLRAGP